MEYNEVLKHLAPCGLDCGRCADYENGEIKQLSAKLLQAMGNNYGRVAKMKSGENIVFNNYRHFEEILTSFSLASCSGCRGEKNLCPIECAAKTCHKEKGVDFCFQCSEYPCQKQFSGRLRERWININNRMKEIGAVEYYFEQVQLPRY
ncbi:hypothetical protein DCCM_2052 [Desulfocucumis palustris]|uniref:DUF3795 domain-containing protein n=1 Tax=Desulfocucumis palustris TaxID=1898651 RepID=A0A2L2X9T3_9FIRM|nr:DUF3795 domain-containing protein [Desulfocucumis palustris]GBF32955.1 hypothetical protein DCCM_2052 [Desulfocucumis palustris]